MFPGPLRARQFGDVEGRVLDVACGTGPNFRYVPDSADLVGIDISEAMLDKARSTLASLNRDGEVHRMAAESLEFPDDHFDAVISAFSTCTFPDPIAALHEMERVCKPGGRIRLLEHGQSDAAPVARLLDWRAEAHFEKHGCRLTHEPVRTVEEAGLPVAEVENTLLGMVTRIETSPRSTRP